MSKSTLSITVPGDATHLAYVVQVPCRLPESFEFVFYEAHSRFKAVAYLSTYSSPAAATVSDVELIQGPDIECGRLMKDLADASLWRIQAMLGIGDPLPPGSPLPAIALAYEAEVASFEAQTKAFRSLPSALIGIGLLPPEPSDEVAGGIASPAARMLAKYVEHVVEQACKALTERAESQAKVSPIRPVTP